MTKTVLVTGCSSGLGRNTALGFAAAGWNVVATMRRPEQLPQGSFPVGVLVQPLDVMDPQSARAAIDVAVQHFGALDALVNNAGVSILSIFETTSPDAIRRVFDTNVFGAMNVTQAAIPALRQSRGVVVNVSSGVGFAAVPLLSLYVASKHALEGFSESVAYELESQHIRVRLVEPGAMRTTAFSANTVEATSSAPVPDGYRAYFDQALGAMLNYPFADTSEQSVVDAILAAANDTSARLRYPVGPDVAEYARLRWTTSEDEYAAGMSRLVGQTAWRDGK
jgi:NAD(P)-dependent dehydrogenase (short-subunit alcohol dehydrogenase family)